ncbi:hypothetical protein DFH06DRAFT_1340127 [Mycena polygramma]|nr:hypothetical protein DFH06DRAFT_1340127 [Mycena polygramma]
MLQKVLLDNAALPRTQELFRALGVLDINKQAGAIPPVRQYILPEGVVPLQTFFRAPPVEPTPARPFGTLIGLGQSHLEAILRDALHKKYPCAVEFGTNLLLFNQDAEGVDAIVCNTDGLGETVRFDFLVGANGARGILRDQWASPCLAPSSS